MHEKTNTLGVPTRSDTNRAVQSQKKARSLKFRIYEEEGYTCVEKTKTLIRCAVTAQLICVFVFAYADCSPCSGSDNKYVIRSSFRTLRMCLVVFVFFFELMLYVPVNSNGHTGSCLHFMGLLPNNRMNVLNKYNHLSKPIRFICMDGLTKPLFLGRLRLERVDGRSVVYILFVILHFLCFTSVSCNLEK